MSRLTLIPVLLLFSMVAQAQTPLYEEEPTQQDLISMLPGFDVLGRYEGYNFLFRNRHIL